MKRILFTLSFILISLIGYSQEKQDFIKVDNGSLGIQTTTTVVHSRDFIQTKIDEYNRILEEKFMEREEWVKLLDQCDKLNIVATQDTLNQQSTEKSSSNLGFGKVIIKDTGTTGPTSLKFNKSGKKTKILK